MLNWQDASPAVYYNIVILPQILVLCTLPPWVIYINMHSSWIMHKPYFKCRAFNSHSALVYTPIWLALPCFHYWQFLGTQKRVKRLTGMDRIFPCVCVWGNICFLFKAIGIAKFCLWLLFLVVIFPRKNAYKCLSLQNSNQNQILYLFILFLKDTAEIVLYLNKREHMAIMRKQPLGFWEHPNCTQNKWAILKLWWNS